MTSTTFHTATALAPIHPEATPSTILRKLPSLVRARLATLPDATLATLKDFDPIHAMLDALPGADDNINDDAWTADKIRTAMVDLTLDGLAEITATTVDGVNVLVALTTNHAQPSAAYSAVNLLHAIGAFDTPLNAAEAFVLTGRLGPNETTYDHVVIADAPYLYGNADEDHFSTEWMRRHLKEIIRLRVSAIPDHVVFTALASEELRLRTELTAELISTEGERQRDRVLELAAGAAMIDLADTGSSIYLVAYAPDSDDPSLELLRALNELNPFEHALTLNELNELNPI